MSCRDSSEWFSWTVRICGWSSHKINVFERCYIKIQCMIRTYQMFVGLYVFSKVYCWRKQWDFVLHVELCFFFCLTSSWAWKFSSRWRWTSWIRGITSMGDSETHYNIKYSSCLINVGIMFFFMIFKTLCCSEREVK